MSGTLISLDDLNALDAAAFTTTLGSVFEHSPWVPEGVAAGRPFTSIIALHRAMCRVVLAAEPDRQLALIRAHPELAGRAAMRGDLTHASTREQKGAGLSDCTPQQYAALNRLNGEYGTRFGFPFILAVKGHTVDSVIAALAERVSHETDEERTVALREICRIAFFRLAGLIDESMGTAILAMAEDLATLSETEDALTCSYFTPAHRATAARIRDFMLAAGLDVHIDAVGNVVGVLNGGSGKRVLTGSHYDTVINAGKFDGRLGIVLPIAVAGALNRAAAALEFPLEIIGFAEEEGVRFKATLLGSRAVAGCFDFAVLDALDAGGRSLREIMAASTQDISGIARDPADVACFVEVHIEQGPVLLNAQLPVGVVSAIAGSIRSLVSVEGLSGHAGTVPMGLRRDAAAAAADMVLAVERRCSAEPGLVGTVGRLEVPGGAINVIPGRCELSVDIRSGVDAVRLAAAADVDAEFTAIAKRRGVKVTQRRVLDAPAVQCAPELQAAWAASIARVTGDRVMTLPSGAGHDAMMMANLTPVGMLFVRCGNGGISHHPAETMTAEDAAVAAAVFQDFLQHYKVTP